MVKDPEKENVYWPSENLKEKAWISDAKIYEKARRDPKAFWAEKAKETLDWFEEWEKIEEWNPPYFNWFIGSKTNLAYNCLDRHLEENRNKTALIWEPEPPEEQQRLLTYQDLYEQVSKFANALKDLGIKKGDPITFWMPMIPETAIAALACQRIGAWHSIVYTAFSPNAVKDRMEDAESRNLITADAFFRGGKTLKLKEKIDRVLEEIGAKNCIVVNRAKTDPPMKKGRDHFYNEIVSDEEPYCEPEPIGAEDISFLLYTSGTTGKPKGIKHSCGAYATQAALTTKWVFDLHPQDIFFSTADIGWITGHSYSLYGPLLNGGTVLWYEGSPYHPEPDRWWKIIDENKVNIFYTAPTAIRALRRKGDEWVEKHDLKSLRILGSVGEPIDPDTWGWFFEKVGGKRCPIVDTYWQTETGGIIITSIPGIGPFIPSVAGPAVPGIKYDVFDVTGKPTEPGTSGKVVLKHPFGPGMLRGVHKAPDKYKEEYWSEYGDEIYFTGDGGRKIDMEIGEQNLIEITGRIDDVLEVAGHRLGTAEIEDAISSLAEITEVAVVGKPHDVKGEVPAVFAVTKSDIDLERREEELKRKIVEIVRKKIGPVATPDATYFVSDVPKTESGKVIRRFLKSLLKDEKLGDVTTVSNPRCLKELAKKVNYKGPEKIVSFTT
ncbi:hypothetical protein AKJ45_00620 [candidate division MSBL1 archaeon SCGC-AAA261F19]|uniref:Acetate--CoA ligase n=1 Tax=candidate division MSBL1 archaeon SCGC-AAA261F19 TaxID=1698275 RepID=A0A133VBH0_9EURY|nr:hypothetical protein AKJ45_00620 [candidate division MSBL1 archaeon SCGC-AAA261F19]